jgi:hypothetical protein
MSFALNRQRLVMSEIDPNRWQAIGGFTMKFHAYNPGGLGHFSKSMRPIQAPVATALVSLVFIFVVVNSLSTKFVTRAPALPTHYPTTRTPPCRHRGRATLKPLECFRMSGKTIGLSDPHTVIWSLTKIGLWSAKRIVNCSHVDVWIIHFRLFTSAHFAHALSSLPNVPAVVAVDSSGEIGEIDTANCMFNQLLTHGSMNRSTTFILASQAASLHKPGQRLFNQQWIIPKQLAKLEMVHAVDPAHDTLDRSAVNLTGSRMMCLGGYPRPHKVQFMGELSARGLLDRMLWSAGTLDVRAGPSLEEMLMSYGYTDGETIEALVFRDRLPRVLDVDRGARKATELSYRPALYNLAKVHLVLESNDRVPSLDRHECARTFRYTEKTLKAMYSGARFILFADPASLELLRSHGFRTFHPHINETYDTISTYREKADALHVEIDRILSMGNEQFDTFFKRTQSMVDHNRQWILSDEFLHQVYKQSLYGFGLSEQPGLESSGHRTMLDSMYSSLGIDCKATH